VIVKLPTPLELLTNLVKCRKYMGLPNGYKYFFTYIILHLVTEIGEKRLQDCL